MHKLTNQHLFVGVVLIIVTILLQGSPGAEAKSKNIIDIYSPAVFNIAVLRNRKPVIVFFSSPKCSLCTTIRNKLEMTAQDQYSEDLYFAKADIDRFPDLMEELGVSQTPTVRTYIKGILTEEIRGLKMPAIKEMFERVAKASRASQRFNKNRFQG